MGININEFYYCIKGFKCLQVDYVHWFAYFFFPKRANFLFGPSVFNSAD